MFEVHCAYSKISPYPVYRRKGGAYFGRIRYIAGVPEVYEILYPFPKDITDQCSSQEQVVKKTMAKMATQSQE